MKTVFTFIYTLALAIVACLSPASYAADPFEPAVLVIVLDGLRPDYVTPELMPNLHALGEAGIVGKNHHAAIPTVESVNASTLATGTHPGTHGIIGTSLYLPEIDPDRGIHTVSTENLMYIEKFTGGRLMTATSLGEHLEAAGKEILVVSSGSPGSAFLLNHKVKGRGILNVDIILPESRREAVIETLGEILEDATPDAERSAWVINAFFMEIDQNGVPDMTFMWLSDPDHTAHEFGIGAEETNLALTLVDEQIGRIVAKRSSAGLDDRLNIIVTTDHGFSTHMEGVNLKEFLREHKLDNDVIQVFGGLYVRSGDKKQIKDIIKILKAHPRIGAIFTQSKRFAHNRKSANYGIYNGTFSFKSIHWQHPRSADILVSPNWSVRKNKYGYAGSTFHNGVAGHDSLSPYDVQLTLIANGPAFKTHTHTQSPTGNVDIAPTICRILGITPATPMDGRVLVEWLKNNDTPLPTTRLRKTGLLVKPGKQTTVLNVTHLGSYRYVDNVGMETMKGRY